MRDGPGAALARAVAPRSLHFEVSIRERTCVIATNYPLLDVVISLLYLAFFTLWIIIVAHLFADIFRSPDLSGGRKVLWVILILALPLVGSLVYLAARGSTMHERRTLGTAAQRAAFEEYVRTVARTKE